eukprot:4390729-Amphidinium_carterae.1
MGSTLACEAASAAIGFDRSCFMRSVMGFITGSEEKHWTQRCEIAPAAINGNGLSPTVTPMRQLAMDNVVRLTALG